MLKPESFQQDLFCLTLVSLVCQLTVHRRVGVWKFKPRAAPFVAIWWGGPLMPVVGIGGDTKRFDLKTCPPDGYVVLRRQSYGEKLSRKAELSKATVEAARDNLKGKTTEGITAQFQMMTEGTTLMDFSKSIVEHNLTFYARPDDPSSETAFDFTNLAHIKKLPAHIGEEIETYITQMNDFEDDADTKE